MRFQIENKPTPVGYSRKRRKKTLIIEGPRGQQRLELEDVSRAEITNLKDPNYTIWVDRDAGPYISFQADSTILARGVRRLRRKDDFYSRLDFSPELDDAVLEELNRFVQDDFNKRHARLLSGPRVAEGSHAWLAFNRHGGDVFALANVHVEHAGQSFHFTLCKKEGDRYMRLGTFRFDKRGVVPIRKLDRAGRGYITVALKAAQDAAKAHTDGDRSAFFTAEGFRQLELLRAKALIFGAETMKV